MTMRAGLQLDDTFRTRFSHHGPLLVQTYQCGITSESHLSQELPSLYVPMTRLRIHLELHPLSLANQRPEDSCSTRRRATCHRHRARSGTSTCRDTSSCVGMLRRSGRLPKTNFAIATRNQVIILVCIYLALTVSRQVCLAADLPPRFGGRTSLPMCATNMKASHLLGRYDPYAGRCQALGDRNGSYKK